MIGCFQQFVICKKFDPQSFSGEFCPQISRFCPFYFSLVLSIIVVLVFLPWKSWGILSHFLFTSGRIYCLFCSPALFLPGLDANSANTMGEDCCRWPTRDRTRMEASFSSPLGRRRIWTVDIPSSGDLWRAWMCVCRAGIGDKPTPFLYFIVYIVCKKEVGAWLQLWYCVLV